MTFGAVLVLLAAMPTALAAQQRSSNPHATLILVAERTAMTPGQPFRVAIHIQVEDGWHVYWRNPGQSGIATTVRWVLPPGFSTGPITWPVPEVFDVAGVRTHVHHGELALGTVILPPLRPAASPARIVAELRYGVCKDACYPGAARLELDLPWGAGSPEPGWAVAERLIEARRPGSPSPFSVAAQLRDTIVTLTVRAKPGQALPDQLTFFPADQDVARGAVTARRAPGAVAIALDLPLFASPARPIRGVLVAGDPSRPRPAGYEVSAAITSSRPQPGRVYPPNRPAPRSP